MVSILLLVVGGAPGEAVVEWSRCAVWRGGCWSWSLDVPSDSATILGFSLGRPWRPHLSFALFADGIFPLLGPWTQKALVASRRALIMDA